MKQIYFDHAATTPLRPEVIEVMHQAMIAHFGNPSSTHQFGRQAKSGVEQARKTIAAQLGAHPSEIIFTSGGTEADNMIIYGSVRDLGVKRVITTAIEHHAVLHPLEDLRDRGLIELVFLSIDERGNPDLNQLTALLTQESTKTLVSLMHVNNEIGTLLDVSRVAQICRDNNALFHSDTVQSIGHFTWNLQEIPIDFLTAAAHKFHGPKGVGFAFIRKKHPIKPLISGGAQERGFRAGTESVHSILGMEKAFVLAYQNLEQEKDYILGLKKYFIDQLKSRIPGVQFNGACSDPEKSTYTVLNVSLPLTTEQSLMMLFQLDMQGIACSKGSACQSGSTHASHVLTELRYDPARAANAIRFSLAHTNQTDEIDYTIDQLCALMAQ
jgi:cysteine desulfurase